MVKIPVWLKGRRPFPFKGDAKFQPINRFSLLLVFDRDVPHGRVKAFITGQVLYGERPYPLLVQPGAEGVPQDVRIPLTLVGPWFMDVIFCFM